MTSKEPKPHIVHISNRTGINGAGMSVLRLIRSSALSGFRHTVVCITDGTPGPLEEVYRRAGAEVCYCPLPHTYLRPWRFWRLVGPVWWVRRLHHVLADRRPNLVHSHAWSRLDLQATAVRRMRCPWVFTVRGVPDDSQATMWRKIAGAVRETPTVAVAISEAVRQGVKRCGFPAPMRVVHNGIDLSEFFPGGRATSLWRGRRGIPQDVTVFGTLGNLGPIKGHDTLVAGARALVECGVRAHFAIGGDGSHRTFLEELIRTSGLANSFHMVGLVHDVPDYLAGLDVFVFPSRSEGFGNALVEALAAGLPCIASNVGGIPEILGEDGGILVPPDDPEALAMAMMRMLDSEVRRHYAEKARSIAQRFSIERCAEQYAQIYRELLEERSG